MDPVEDLYEPDEARPAKRARLDAPLAITEEVQEEMVDDEDDWDDIYGNASTPGGVPIPDGGVSLATNPVEDALSTASLPEEEPPADVVPAVTVDDGDNLVARNELVAATDEPSAQVLEETSAVETGPYRKDEPSTEGDQQQTNGHSIPVNANGDASEQHLVTNAALPISSEVYTLRDDEDDTATAKPKPAQDGEFMAAAAAQKSAENAEWQFDSSDAGSKDSDSDSSSDSSEASESGSDGGYEMLDPATAAKMLMSGDGEDDDGDKSKNKTGDHQPRTANEVQDAVVPKPDVVVTEDMKITFLGTVDRAVESMVLIKAVTPGEFQVLESGSVLCNEQRVVIGAVAETLGRVQEPMYSVAFTNAEEIEATGMQYGAKVYYVDSHSTVVFTQPLKNLKGTDASNIHDEEVGEDELEFSDDEQEAEYKRMKKQAKRGGRGGLSRSAFNEERSARTFGAPGHDSGYTYINGSDAPEEQYGGGINYDDEDNNVQEEFYVPLKRPGNLSQIMAGGGPPSLPQRGNFQGRGRGDRGRGRGDRGRGRGGFDRNQRGGRGGSGQNDNRRGGSQQQNGHRGPSHSFPDRHNNRRANGNKRQFDRRGSHNSASQGSSPPPAPPPQQSYSPYQQPTQPQAPTPQTYQFNGYQFQYGNPPPLQQSTPQPTYYNQQPPAAQSPPPAIPAGAYVNPAFFQNQQAPAQWTQPQQPQAPGHAAWSPQQYQQYQPYAQPGAPQPPQQGQNDIAALLRQLSGYQQQQQQQ